MRVKTLDWLRGLAALSVMLYHFSGSILGRIEESSTILGRLGIYAVTIFFILSGLSLSIAHSNFKRSVEIQAFFIKRILRLWPVYIIILYIGLYLGLTMHVSDPYSPMLVIKNYLMLFSVSDTNNYLIPTVWSIGNEIVYYALFPIIILIYSRSIRIGNAILISAFVWDLYYAKNAFDQSVSLYSQWGSYIDPLNHIFVFMAGVALFFNLRDIVLEKCSLIPLYLVSLPMIIFAGYTGDQIFISSGIGKIAFEVASIILVAAVYLTKVNPPRLPERALNALGNYSYSIYLAHVFVAEEVLRVFWGESKEMQFIYAIVITISIAAFLYKFVEKPCIDYGKRITKQA